MNAEVMFSSKTDQWATPQDFFDKLNDEFDFTLDPCADESNHKCDLYYTKEQNGLIQKWGGREYSVIPHTAERLVSGFKSVLKKVKTKIPFA